MNTEEIRDKVEYALDSIRSFLRADGGDVKLISIDDDVVTIKLLGNCESCQMSEMTMKAGIEEAIKKEVPQIKAVREYQIK